MNSALPVAVVAGTIVISGAVATSAQKKKKKNLAQSNRAWGIMGDAWDGLTFLGQVLARRDGANVGEGDGHESAGSEGREKGGYEVGVREMSLDGGDAKGGIIIRLSINEGAQERKCESGRKEEHGGILSKNGFMTTC